MKIIKEHYNNKMKLILDESPDYSKFQQEWDDLQSNIKQEQEDGKIKFEKSKQQFLDEYKKFVSKYMKYHGKDGEGLWWYQHKYDCSECPEVYIKRVEKYTFGGPEPSDEFGNWWVELDWTTSLYGFHTSYNEELTVNELKSVLGPQVSNYIQDIERIRNLLRTMIRYNVHRSSVNAENFPNTVRSINLFQEYLEQGANDVVTLLRRNGYPKTHYGDFKYTKGPNKSPSFTVRVMHIHKNDIETIKQLIQQDGDIEVFHTNIIKANLTQDEDVDFNVLFSIWMPGLKNKHD